jgi:hypothetical protein
MSPKMFYRGLKGSRLASIALQIVREVAEVKKPDAERLDGFHEAQQQSMMFSLYSPAPVYTALEEFRMADGLQESLENLGKDDEFVTTVLGSSTPADVAAKLIRGTKLQDPTVRKALVEGGAKAVAESSDPLIVVARAIDPMLRASQKEYENKIASIETAAGEKIGKARFAAYGRSTYPDATFTLRLSYGTVKGYAMNGTEAPPMTTFYGLYDRAAGFGFKPPFDIPKRFIDRKDALNLSTPFNFVSSTDVVGGNSGSPIINRKGELVGLVFDGNIESLVGTYVYDINSNRTVGVHTSAMLEALRKMYDAAPLASELTGR